MNMVVISLKKDEVDKIITSVFERYRNVSKNTFTDDLIPAVIFNIMKKLDGKGNIYAKKMGIHKMRELFLLLEE